MSRLTTLALLALVSAVLVACAAPAPRQIASFKKPGAEMYSAAAFQPEKITGSWRQVAAYAQSGSPGCAAGALAFSQTAAGLAVQGQLCLNGELMRLSGPLRSIGPGRLAVPGMEDWWVIWVDSGYRTLAIATPSGRYGFVLDRSTIPYDRLVAAREIFDFNGYSRQGLQPF